MSDRRTQSYTAIPREEARVQALRAEFLRRCGVIETDPPDFEPELPPSPTFWPRDEPKEQPPR